MRDVLRRAALAAVLATACARPTPEARTLKALRDSARPAFGFDLHDQNARTLGGPGGQQVAIALLAPPTDDAGSWGPTRASARLVAAVVALDTVEAAGLFLHPAPQMLTEQRGARWLRLGAPAAFTLRRGRDAASEAVRTVGEGPVDGGR